MPIMPGSEPSAAVYPLMPLRGMVVFPHTVMPLEVGRRRSLLALDAAMKGNRRIVLATQKEVHVDDPSPDDLYTVGVIAEVKQVLKMSENQVRMFVEGLQRVEIHRFQHLEPYFQVAVVPLEPAPVEAGSYAEDVEVLIRSARRLYERYVRVGRKLPPEVVNAVQEMSDPSRLADTITAQLPLEPRDKQSVLETVDIIPRLEKVCALLTREIELIDLEKRIETRVRKQMEGSHKEYYLRERMKAIQKELGEKDEKEAEIQEYKDKIAKARMPKEARQKALHELKRLEKMPPMSAEAAVVRTYLDWLVHLPWSKRTRDRIDLAAAEALLDRDHYGLQKVKERVLEFLAVRQLTRDLKGPILCLVGPPGVGKTSLARSIAEAMGRKFVRFSLGGVRDEAEIRGHRRTYVGAMPGKIIQALRQAGSRNPVILLDEVDKMGADFRGDPSSALLEVLDPEQNHGFQDHYLEVPFDLSDVMFITTANLLYPIPPALRDRMEVVAIPGYTEEEKLAIARRHLLPKQREAHGLKPEQLAVSDNALRRMIEGYTREAGVRQLERQLAAICRKAARAIVSAGEGDERRVRVDARNLERYLGAPRYRRRERERNDRVGVANGLAYTETGGELMEVEVAVVPGKGQLTLTGKLGEVMRESAHAGFSYLRSRARALGIPTDFHERSDIHIHIPEGAVPKDGPSAGITMALALISALRGIPLRSDVAMTGEITLRGRVLPVGGIKEKVLAARRSGVTTVLLPKGNEKDLEDVPEEVRRGLDIVFVSHMDEALEVAFSKTLTLAHQSFPPLAVEEEEERLPFVPDVVAGDGGGWGEQPAPPHA